MANHLTEGLAGAPEAIGKAVTKVNDCSSGLRRAVEATFIAGAEDTHHLLEGVGHGAQDGMGKSAEAVEKAAKEAKHQVELVMPAIILVVWTASAVALTYHTKWTLSSHGAAFTFPVFYTFVTTATILLGCSTIMIIQKKTNTVGLTQFREQWKGVMGVAILSILAIWSSDASMMYIGVTLNQLLKACTPFPTMLFGICIERKTFAWPMVLAVMMIVVGAGLAVPIADATGSTYGLVMAGLSTLFAACKISLAARLMSDSANNGLTPLILLFYSSLASVPVYVEKKPRRGPKAADTLAGSGRSSGQTEACLGAESSLRSASWPNPAPLVFGTGARAPDLVPCHRRAHRGSRVHRRKPGTHLRRALPRVALRLPRQPAGQHAYQDYVRTHNDHRGSRAPDRYHFRHGGLHRAHLQRAPRPHLASPSAKAAAPHRASSLARPGKHRHQPALLERSRFSTGSVSLSSCLRLSRMRTCRSTRR